MSTYNKSLGRREAISCERGCLDVEVSRKGSSGRATIEPGVPFRLYFILIIEQCASLLRWYRGGGEAVGEQLLNQVSLFVCTLF